MLLVCNLNCLFSAVDDKSCPTREHIKIVFVIKLKTSNYGYFFVNLNLTLYHTYFALFLQLTINFILCKL